MKTEFAYRAPDELREPRWPDLKKAASAAYMGLTVYDGNLAPWLIIGHKGSNTYLCENTLGEVKELVPYVVDDYVSDHNRLVAASRIEGSPYALGMKTGCDGCTDCKCKADKLKRDEGSGEWDAQDERGHTLDVEKLISDLEEAGYKVHSAEEHHHEETDFACAECGSNDLNFEDESAQCNDCGEVMEVEAKVAADEGKREDDADAPLKCPQCGSHTVRPTRLDDKGGESDFGCHACGKMFKHKVIVHTHHIASALTRHSDNVERSLLSRLLVVLDNPPSRGRDIAVARDLQHLHRIWGDQHFAAELLGVPQPPRLLAKVAEDTRGAPLREGGMYELHGAKFKVPNILRIMSIEDGLVVAKVEESPVPLRITEKDIERNQYSFEPTGVVASNFDDHVLAAGYDMMPAATDMPMDMPASDSGVLTVATPSGGSLLAQVDNGLVTGWQVPDSTGQPVGPMLTRDLDKVQQIVDGYGGSTVAKTAARSAMSLLEQHALINESGKARNKHKVKLEGTHYQVESTAQVEDVDDDPYWLW